MHCNVVRREVNMHDYSDMHRDLVKIGFGSRDMLADRQTDRHVDTQTRSSHRHFAPCRAGVIRIVNEFVGG